MKSLLLLFTVLSIVLYSCRKEDDIEPVDIDQEEEPVNIEPDTIAPHLACFPTDLGSYWVYDNGDSARIKDDYELAQLYEYYLPPDDYWSTPPGYSSHYMPVYIDKTGSKTLYNYSFLPHSNYYAKQPLYKEEPKDYWEVEFNEAWHYKSFTVIDRDSIIPILGLSYPTTVIRTNVHGDYFNPDYLATPLYWGELKYYAEGIGLVRYEWRDYEDSTWHEVNLTEYAIGG